MVKVQPEVQLRHVRNKITYRSDNMNKDCNFSKGTFSHKMRCNNNIPMSVERGL